MNAENDTKIRSEIKKATRRTRGEMYLRKYNIVIVNECIRFAGRTRNAVAHASTPVRKLRTSPVVLSLAGAHSLSGNLFRAPPPGDQPTIYPPTKWVLSLIIGRTASSHFSVLNVFLFFFFIIIIILRSIRLNIRTIRCKKYPPMRRNTRCGFKHFI